MNLHILSAGFTYLQDCCELAWYRLDAPRRRADSFPNSTIGSLRSATPDFSRIPLSPGESPLTSPGSPLSPIIKGADPTPLTLNPEQVASAASGKWDQSPTKSIASRPISTKDSSSTSRRGSDESTTMETQLSSERDHGSTSSTTGDSGIITEAGAQATVAVNKDDRKAPFSPKLTPVSGSIHESLMTVSINPQQQAVTTMTGSCHPLAHMPTSQMPPIHPAEPAVNSHGVGIKAIFEAAPPPQDSIEQQVMSTQISENSHCSSTVRSTLPPHQFLSGPGFSSKASSNEIISAASSIRSQRLILQPLDVKTSAGTTTMNVSASQHSRKCKSDKWLGIVSFVTLLVMCHLEPRTN